MKRCALCKKEIEIDKYFSQRSSCPACSGDLHICLNCSFYSESSHNKCSEPKAEFQRSRDKANFCDYFLYAESTLSVSNNEKEAARKRLDDLFNK